MTPESVAVGVGIVIAAVIAQDLFRAVAWWLIGPGGRWRSADYKARHPEHYAE